MFDIGFTELLIVAIVGLVVIGPERLPSTIRTVALWVGRIRRTLGNVQKEISEELRVDEMRQAAKKQQERLEAQVDEISRPFNETLREDILSTDSSNSSGSSDSSSSEKAADRKSAAE